MLPFPSPGDLPDPGTEPASSALAGRFFTAKPPGKPIYVIVCLQINTDTYYSSLPTHFTVYTVL